MNNAKIIVLVFCSLVQNAPQQGEMPNVYMHANVQQASVYQVRPNATPCSSGYRLISSAAECAQAAAAVGYQGLNKLIRGDDQAI